MAKGTLTAEQCPGCGCPTNCQLKGDELTSQQINSEIDGLPHDEISRQHDLVDKDTEDRPIRERQSSFNNKYDDYTLLNAGKGQIPDLSLKSASKAKSDTGNKRSMITPVRGGCRERRSFFDMDYQGYSRRICCIYTVCYLD